MIKIVLAIMFGVLVISAIGFVVLLFVGYWAFKDDPEFTNIDDYNV